MAKRLKVLTKTEVYDKRLEIYKEQNGICPICKKKIRFDKSVLDHKHKLLKSDKLGKNGGGLIRGVLCHQCNSLEGVIFNGHRRYGLHKKKIDLPTLLRNIADYLEKDPLPIIHPSEIKQKTLSKRNYNKLKKAYAEKGLRKKLPEYPKSKKITKALKELFEQFKINPYN